MVVILGKVRLVLRLELDGFGFVYFVYVLEVGLDNLCEELFWLFDFKGVKMLN